MLKYYIDRDAGNNVVGLFKRPQYEGQERLDSNHPDVLAYFAAEDANEINVNKLNILKEATIDQFKFIIALFEVGKANGIWVNSDFEQALLQKGAEWKQLIQDLES